MRSGILCGVAWNSMFSSSLVDEESRSAYLASAASIEPIITAMMITPHGKPDGFFCVRAGGFAAGSFGGCLCQLCTFLANAPRDSGRLVDTRTARSLSAERRLAGGTLDEPIY